jgi:hypothetical protein
MLKRYTDLNLRFWYFDRRWREDEAPFKFNLDSLRLAKVSEVLTGRITLTYENKPNTILNAYFTVLVNAGSHYTELEGYLTPVQYSQLDGSVMAMFNGDQYYVAEVSAYDPTGRNKTTIKLIRKI